MAIADYTSAFGLELCYLRRRIGRLTHEGAILNGRNEILDMRLNEARFDRTLNT